MIDVAPLPSQVVTYPMFDELDIETHGACNRTCPTCMRNSLPNRASVADRFGRLQRLPEDLFRKVIDNAVDMGFRGRLNMQHFNEPFQDQRLARLGDYARATAAFAEVAAHTNGDLITPRKAREVDGIFDRFTVALYDEVGGRPLAEPAMSERKAYLTSLFKVTRLEFTNATHLITHFSPYVNLQAAIAEFRGRPCTREVQMRMIVDYRGEMLLCCEDIVGLWKLGNVADQTVAELWRSPKHQQILATLAQPGGREAYGFCRSCPRVGTW